MRHELIGRAKLIALVSMREPWRSEEHTSELQSQSNLVCRLLLEKKKQLFIVSLTAYSAGTIPSSHCLSYPYPCTPVRHARLEASGHRHVHTSTAAASYVALASLY